jgi:glycosyltransferase involved in cell wall biosynthesis
MMARAVCFFTDSRAFGGAEEALFMLVEGFDRSEWHVSLLAPPTPIADELADRCGELGIPFRLVDPMPLGLDGARRVPKLIRTLRREQPDVFHAHLSGPTAAKYPLVAAVMARVPAVVATVQLVPPFRTDRSNWWQLRMLARRVDGYVAVSRDIQQRLIQELGWPPGKVEVVYNAVRPEYFAPVEESELRSSLTGLHDRPVVLTTARLDEQKGHALLLEAAAVVPDALFLLAGDGPSRRQLEARVADLGLSKRVVFLGQRSDIRELLMACDVFVLPSLYEGSSLAVLEAMASGRAIVATGIPGTDELIEDGVSGLLVPPTDDAALAGAIRRLLDDDELRRRLGAKARAHAEVEFTRDAMATRITSTYRRLLGAHDPAVAPASSSALNPMLRRLDWRFLIEQSGEPTILNLARGRLRGDLEALSSEKHEQTGEAVDLVVLDHPTPQRLQQAYDRLAPGGTVYAEWQMPRPGNTRRISQALAKAGFEDARVFWAGPRPFGSTPEFWVSLTEAGPPRFLLASRQNRGPQSKLVQTVWMAAARAGALAPLGAVARRGAASNGPPRNPGAHRSPGLLLTPGQRSINKVVGLVFEGGPPVEALKFARVPGAEPGLDREARVLREIADQRPQLEGIPRVLGTERRMGRLAVRESVLVGTPMTVLLSQRRFPDLARAVTSWLLELAGSSIPVQRSAWWDRLVEAPFREFIRQFEPVLTDQLMLGLRESLDRLGDLPVVPEHRDCSPWNIVWLGPDKPGLHDWESAEPLGLPALDLVYFLANSAFILDDALSTGRTQLSYRNLLDSSTPTGTVARTCLSHYCAELGLDTDLIPSLRVLTWIVHARSDFRHLQLDGMTPKGLKAAPCLGLLEEELGSSRRSP